MQITHQNDFCHVSGVAHAYRQTSNFICKLHIKLIFWLNGLRLSWCLEEPAWKPSWNHLGGHLENMEQLSVIGEAGGGAGGDPRFYSGTGVRKRKFSLVGGGFIVRGLGLSSSSK